MTASLEFALFDTAIGRCGIAWGRRGVVGVQLPEARVTATRARVKQRFPGAREAPPPPAVKRAVDGIAALLGGAGAQRSKPAKRSPAADLASVALDMDGVPPFHRRVYEVMRETAPGATLSYGDVAAWIGSPGAARAVGQALKRNPFSLIVPCHRVLAAGGKVGGFTATGGVVTKMRIIELESPPVAAPAAGLFAGDAALGFDPIVALAHLRRADSSLGRLIDAVGPFGMQLASASSLFVALAHAIVYQQLNGKAAATIFGRVCALFTRVGGGAGDGAGDALTAEDILAASDEALRGAGLSRSKLASLRDLARRTVDGEIPPIDQLRSMDSDAIVECLTEVRGIGRWTVEMLLMFRLGRPDVFPADDYGIRQGFAAAFRKRELPSRDEMEKRSLRWKPYRTVASWYLWRAAERARKQNAASR